LNVGFFSKLFDGGAVVPDARITDYDAIASEYDRRFAVHSYDGVRQALLNFLGESTLTAILEVGCGTGHWLSGMAGRATLIAGLDRSAPMLARARRAAPDVHLVRGLAEWLPWRDLCFDRVACVNALHHFTDRAQFFSEARRVLRRGGGLLSIGLDPHTGRDDWWVYDWFPETKDIDRARFAPVRILRGEMAAAGFAWAESFEADHLESHLSLAQVFPDGVIPRGFTSQLSVLSDDAFERGAARIREAAIDGELVLAADLRLYATTGWTD
jgi:SAM-dependent methyltransferase